MKKLAIGILLSALSVWAQDITINIKATNGNSTASTSVVYQNPLVTYSISSGTTNSAGVVVLNISIASHTAKLPAGLQFDLTYSAGDVSGVGFTAGSAATAAGKSITCSIVSAGDLRCLIAGINSSIIMDGVVAVATVQTLASSPNTSTTLSLTGALAYTTSAASIPAVVTSGGGIVTITPVAPVPPILLGISCSPTMIQSGTSSTCTITLSKPVSATTVVTLINDQPTLVSMPSSLTIVAGASSGTFVLGGV